MWLEILDPIVMVSFEELLLMPVQVFWVEVLFWILLYVSINLLFVLSCLKSFVDRGFMLLTHRLFENHTIATSVVETFHFALVDCFYFISAELLLRGLIWRVVVLMIRWDFVRIYRFLIILSINNLILRILNHRRLALISHRRLTLIFQWIQVISSFHHCLFHQNFSVGTYAAAVSHLTLLFHFSISQSLQLPN